MVGLEPFGIGYNNFEALMSYNAMVEAIEGKNAESTEEEINSVTNIKDDKKSFLERHKKGIIISTAILAIFGAWAAGQDNTVNNNSYLDNQANNSPTGNILDNIPNNGQTTNTHTVDYTVDYTDDDQIIDTIKDNKDKKPVVEKKPIVDIREKVMTSDGEIYGKVLKSWGGGLEVDTDGDGYLDYYRHIDAMKSTREALEKKGLSDFCDEYCGEYGINTVIEKYNTDGQRGIDEVRVYFNGERDENGNWKPGTGVEVYKGMGVGTWGAMAYIGRCSHLNDEKWEKYISDDVRKGCIKDLSK